MELTKIKGISEAREKELNKLGIFATEDLIKFFPKTYLDLRSKQLIKNSYHNDMVLTPAKVIGTSVVRYFRGRGIAKATCEQEGLIFSVVWFNQPYVLSKLKIGQEYLFFGRINLKGGVIELVNPSFEPCEKVYRLKGIMPQYSTKNKLPQKTIRDAVSVSVFLEKPTSLIPSNLQAKYDLANLYNSYQKVHNPTSFDDIKIASERIAIEEYFLLISAFRLIKGDKQQIRYNKYSCTRNEIDDFIKEKFDFKFTEGQQKAVEEIYSDMTGQTVMNRLMQGDVGSGKTAVSIVSIYIAVKNGYQCVMLAPTEVLAIQNYNIIKSVFNDKNVALLTGSTPLKEKKILKSQIKSGTIDIVVGTHAVLQQDVEFNNLSLCVCDEQQRFGVAQRSNLTKKGIAPDTLVMSATPIPRTLALIFYGDLDITSIKDKPLERQIVQTNFVPKEKYSGLFEFVKKQVEEGRQAYFVCPKIDGDEEGTLMSVTELFESVKEKLQGVKVGLLHGKLKEQEKNKVMLDFKNKVYDVLVSTTVIEVGVDVKDATVMAIFNAERFGLSQLHQLRGRVGRSNLKSYCFLMSDARTDNAVKRLEILTKNFDGFKISEYDYKMRGGGDFMGIRQSGKIANDLGCLEYSTDAIFIAKKISDEMFENGQLSEEIKKVAIKKYDKLKDIILN